MGASPESAAAAPGEILASEEFRHALRGPWQITALAPVALKGKRRPIPAHRIGR